MGGEPVKVRLIGLGIAVYFAAMLLLLMGWVWFGDAGADDPAPAQTAVITPATPVGEWRT